jgi:DMSO/TMAO reductase YedYZ heme-binding membrane subunit
MTGPFLWYANRGTGVVLLVLLTVTTLLGVLSTRGDAGSRVPRFLIQAMHRSLSLTCAALLLGHVTTAVVDEYVDIRWWQVVVPVGATYRPLSLGLGTVAFDLVLVVVATSLLRSRLPHRAWRTVHVSAYACWMLAVAHGLGIGTDVTSPWARTTGLVCVVAVSLAAGLRLVGLGVTRVRLVTEADR